MLKRILKDFYAFYGLKMWFIWICAEWAGFTTGGGYSNLLPLYWRQLCMHQWHCKMPDVLPITNTTNDSVQINSFDAEPSENSNISAGKQEHTADWQTPRWSRAEGVFTHLIAQNVWCTYKQIDSDHIIKVKTYSMGTKNVICYCSVQNVHHQWLKTTAA